MIRVCSLFSIFSFMGIRSVRGAVFVVLAVAALAFMAYRFAVYSSPAQKQARWVKATEQEIQALQATIDSLQFHMRKLPRDVIPAKALMQKDFKIEDYLSPERLIFVKEVEYYQSKRDSLRRELNRSKSASKR